eukprot:CAMPEP_0170515282 /NCGR_PEP_ID=MMETSP0209-20121228/1721_1 /TAXON_ID=665100 ORGANISM="Litonotus pictus, Strain P1" /NCGR_SAMPLE_ID=MMETSP0209 /ASSEMBLY_ACC=CAM_ASM_000301 /LENGTH=1089 /DNA_ID=CAMNT_0010799683 /DNA_START=4 /DNA_END=3273 /DNA_ORIENTATION=+
MSDISDNEYVETPKPKLRIGEVQKQEIRKKFKSHIQALLDTNDIISAIRSINIGSNSDKVLFSGKNPISNKASLDRNVKRLADSKQDEKLDLEEDDIYSDYFKLEKQPENLVGGELKEYQLDGLNWLLRLHFLSINGILADEMGLGKTIQSIALIAYLEQTKKLPKKYIVIVPKVTLNNWKNEFTKWLPTAKLLIFYGNKEERKRLVEVDLKEGNYDVLITTYECAMKEKSYLSRINFEYIMIDEAHRIKNKKSKLATDLRSLNANHKLLITGTPLQNNLTELWSLLNFLMPKIFNNLEDFDDIFNLEEISDQNDQLRLVSQIHTILKPFVLRRLKSEVQFKIPPKKELYLYIGLSDLQKALYKQILTKNVDSVNGFNKDKIQLLNVLMQLKKVCNHPYLFPKVEQGPPFITGDHLIENSMKLFILDKLLQLKISQGSKVLVFSQMVTLINILDDYCRYRNYKFCRIDGSTSREDRDRQIDAFQSPDNTDIFIFLLSTRSGGLGINLHAANTVVIFDSDWNPQVDLQAIDRAHRIGQNKEVTIYRFVTEGTVEEKIIERAAKKLKIDHLIIQKGKTVQNKPTALEVNSMIHYGAADIFNQTEEAKKEFNIFDIIKYSENKTDEVSGKLKSLEDKMNITNLSLISNPNDIYQFEGEDYKKYTALENNFINVGNFGARERKFLYTNFQGNQENLLKLRKPRVLTGWRANANGGYDHQLFNRERLDKLDMKEQTWNDYLEQIQKLADSINDEKNESKPEKKEEISESNISSSKENEICLSKKEKEKKLEELISKEPSEFNSQDEEEREFLLSQGFAKWSKKDYQRLCEALKTISSSDYIELSKVIKGKSPEDIKQYLDRLLKSLHTVKGALKLQGRIEEVNQKNKKIEGYHLKIRKYFEQLADKSDSIYNSIELEDVIKAQPKSKAKTNKAESSKMNYEVNLREILPKPEFCSLNLNDDKYLVCMLFKYGYGNWSKIKYHILFDPKMRYNLFLKTLSTEELKERCSELIGKIVLQEEQKPIVRNGTRVTSTVKNKGKKGSEKNIVEDVTIKIGRARKGDLKSERKVEVDLMSEEKTNTKKSSGKLLRNKRKK